MAYNLDLANRVREYLFENVKYPIEEKAMFGGLAFMVNGKMCVNVSGERLMCRFDPALEDEMMQKNGYQPMNMKGKNFKGYCYIEPEGFISNKDFEYFITKCLEFNEKAKSSKKQ